MDYRGIVYGNVLCDPLKSGGAARTKAVRMGRLHRNMADIKEQVEGLVENEKELIHEYEIDDPWG